MMDGVAGHIIDRSFQDYARSCGFPIAACSFYL
jgi:hypothetical protein